MFRCELCGTLTPPRTHCTLVTVQSAQRCFPMREKANRPVWKWDKKKEKWRKVRTDDPGGEGDQIARTCKACPACAARTHP